MWTILDSPIGPLRLVAQDGALVAIDFTPFITEAGGELAGGDPLLARVVTELGQYFAGERTEFDVPLAPVGTEFQQRVWTRLRSIPYGQTATYGQIARDLGMPVGAARAVGLANGRNPIPIVIPCHRVIGADGTLTGYAGGLDRKRTLLDLECGALF